MKKVNYKLIRGGGLHYLAILPMERREVSNLNNTSTSFCSTIGGYYG